MCNAINMETDKEYTVIPRECWQVELDLGITASVLH